MTNAPAPARHRAAAVLLVAYSLFLAFVLLNPSSDVPTSSINWLAEIGLRLHLPPALVQPDRVEFVSNVLIIAPVPFIGSLLVPRLGWRDWTAYGFVASGLVELAQGVFLPDRTATFSDVVANTGGALVGAVAFKVVMRAAGWRAGGLSARDAGRRAGGAPPPPAPGPARSRRG